MQKFKLAIIKEKWKHIYNIRICLFVQILFQFFSLYSKGFTVSLWPQVTFNFQ